MDWWVGVEWGQYPAFKNDNQLVIRHMQATQSG